MPLPTTTTTTTAATPAVIDLTEESLEDGEVEEVAGKQAAEKKRKEKKRASTSDAERPNTNKRNHRSTPLASNHASEPASIWTIAPKKRRTPHPASAGPEAPREASEERPAKKKPTYTREERYTRPRTRSPSPSSSSSPASAAPLSRQEIIDLQNTGETISRVLSLYRKYAADSVTHAERWSLRSALHKAPFLRVNTRYRHLVTQPLESLLSSGGRLGVPDDVLSDAEYLLRRWQAGDFNPDLLRGIDKTLRYDAVNKRKHTAQSLDKSYPFKRSASVAGHNGLVVGQWWPLQICAVRDGAHGATEGGIWADKEAAVSIIISGGSGYQDEDRLNTVWYSGTAGEGPGLPSANTLAMMKAMDIGRPVRVLRSAKARSRYAPKEGLRYDGLYLVREKEMVDRDCEMWRFRLERQRAGQPEVRWKGDGVRPTTIEREWWEDHRDIWKLMS
ncbi:PUA-like domain-containing protein [Sphaerosporella brunnea]|uniref:PUA-like domain-containing protein n=1 Tax=Sphaerosporella brunnea TaxID=1250544 RepID=A0A5J5F8I2_9PEZI|nr:PUA-like domain-containing protein [Sphaerosporella brunnea]